MEIFRRVTNQCIRAGLESNLSSLKSLSKSVYGQLDKSVISYYRLHAISKAAGILASRKKSIKRGFPTKNPYLNTSMLVSSYGFKIKDGMLKIPLGNKNYFDIKLNDHVKRILLKPNIEVRSFTLSARNNSLNISYAKDVEEMDCEETVGIDRNLCNLTVGNEYGVIDYNLVKADDVIANTKSVYKSFKRNDVRIRTKLYAKYGKRRKDRVNQLLHNVSKIVATKAREVKTSIAFEDITHIRKLYRKGNYQGKKYRGRMNSWPFGEIKRQIQYKAQWLGVPVIQLSVKDTQGTSSRCHKCGERLQYGSNRELACKVCGIFINRDINAVLNIARIGRARFARSKGITGEAMVQESDSKELVILKVDVMKQTSAGTEEHKRVNLQHKTQKNQPSLPEQEPQNPRAITGTQKEFSPEQ